MISARLQTYERRDGVQQILLPTLHCTRCGNPLSDDGKFDTCYRCGMNGMIDGINLERVMAVTLYIPDLKGGYQHNKEIWELKDRGMHAGEYAEVMAFLINKEQRFNPHESIIIVPIPPTSLKPNGTSGPLALANALSIFMDLPVVDCLQFNRPMVKQKGLKEKERQLNMVNSMDFPIEIPGKTVILVDDVMTTCTTMMEAARAVTYSGALRTFGIVAGRNSRIEELVKVGVLERV